MKCTSALLFGIGHIVNLLNGQAIPEILMQICYAVAIGFLFTIIFYKGKSLWPCIITHSVINSISAFVNEENAPTWHGIATSVFLCVVSLAYAVYIIYKTKETKIEYPIKVHWRKNALQNITKSSSKTKSGRE